jgi:integrase
MLKDQITAFFESERFTSLAPSTQQTYQHAIGNFEQFCQQEAITKITPQADLAGFATWLKSKDSAPATIKQYLTVVKLLIKETTGKHISYTYRVPRKDKQDQMLKRMDRWFNENEIAQCLAYKFKAKDDLVCLRNQTLVRLLIETGARVREIAGLKADRIDIPERTLWVDKSKTEPRPIFISPETAMLLEAYKNRMILAEAWRGLVFPAVKQIQRVVADMLVEMGLKNGSDGRGPHTFRHYRATWLYYVGGMSLADIGFLLGDTPDTIRAEYLHPTAPMLRKKVDAATGWDRK